MNMPPDILAKKPPPLFCIARDRESGQVIVFEKHEPRFHDGWGRKRSREWWRSGYWCYQNAWNNHSNWDTERAVKTRAYWQDYKEIIAETEEKALEQYKLETGN